MHMADDIEIGRRLKAAREASGYGTAKAAAEALGIPYATYVQHENGRRGIVREADLYARRFKISLDWLMRGRGEAPGPTDRLVEVAAPIGGVKIKGKVAANTWMSVDDMDFGYDDEEFVPVVGGYPVDMQFALRVDGNCLNKVAAHGDLLVCLDIIKALVDIKPDDLVIVERSRFDGQMVERTAKRVRRSVSGFELWPESTDPAHQDPIILEEKREAEEVRVIGKVLWIMRKP
jgi:transcriptional regulator with XRE-family HTH domain